MAKRNAARSTGAFACIKFNKEEETEPVCGGRETVKSARSTNERTNSYSQDKFGCVEAAGGRKRFRSSGVHQGSSEDWRGCAAETGGVVDIHAQGQQSGKMKKAMDKRPSASR